MQRIADAPAAPTVTIEVEGRPVEARSNESLAVALALAGHDRLRDSARVGTPRGAFCMMGVCQECVVECDGRRVASCMEPVRDGMSVRLGRRT